MAKSIIRKVLFATICTTMISSNIFAQDSSENGVGLWSSIGVEKSISKGFNADIEIEYRVRDNFSHTDRWTIGTGLSYRLYRNSAKTFTIKADLGYKYMNVWNAEKRSDKDLYVHPDADYTFLEYNIDEAYDIAKHRGYVSLSASYELGRFKFGLRERYQTTYNGEKQVMEHKFRYDETPVDGDTDGIEGSIVKTSELELKEAKTSNTLRSRLSIDYDIPNFKFNPFCTIELFNNLNNRMILDKTRYIIGGEYKYKKVHIFKLYYQYQNLVSDDEPNNSVIGFNYKFEF